MWCMLGTVFKRATLCSYMMICLSRYLTLGLSLALLSGCASVPPEPETLSTLDPNGKAKEIKSLSMNPKYVKFMARLQATQAKRAPATEPGHLNETTTKGTAGAEAFAEHETADTVKIPAPTTERASWDYANDVFLAGVQNYYGSVTFNGNLKFGEVEIKPGTYTWQDLGKILEEFVLNCEQCLVPQARPYLQQIKEGKLALWPYVDYQTLDQLVQAEKLADQPIANVQTINSYYKTSNVGLRPAGIFRSLTSFYRNYFAAYNYNSYLGGPNYQYSQPYAYVNDRNYFKPQITNAQDFEVVFEQIHEK